MSRQPVPGQADGVPAVSVSGLRLKFPGSESLLFEDLSFEALRGQKVLLLGPSGCGKSTLLQVLCGLVPQAIEIPMKCDAISIPSSWGYLFQDPDAQFCMSYVDEELAFVLENLAVPREHMDERIRHYLELVGLHLPHPHTEIRTLSGGMKQRLALASVLALEAEVWLLDEPTALLDPEGTRDVWASVRALSAGKTVLIVEHKIDEIQDFVDRVVLFDGEANILADGPPAEIFLQHRAELHHYGIWYPQVWEDYDRSRRQEPAAAVPRTTGMEAGREPLIRLTDFAGSYGRSERIRMPAAAVYDGDWVAVIGENGAGKSTLLQTLMGLLPGSGTYLLDGRPVRGFDDTAAHAGYVFQNPELQFVAHTVWDEVAFNFRRDGLAESEAARETELLLEWFGLSAHRHLHPFQLSLGQKRRLSVAAATVQAQKLVLLDEPTFGQDAVNTFALLEKLEAWRRGGMAIIMVTHDSHIVSRFATRVWEIREGVLVRETAGSELAEELAARRRTGTPPSTYIMAGVDR